MARNLTHVSVAKLKPPPAGQVEYYDKRLPGFGVRLSYKGTRSWFVMTRLDGKLIRVTMGRYPALSLAEAREQAWDIINQTAAGNDPRLARKKARQNLQQERQNTFAACVGDFMRKHVERHLRPSTQREYRRILTGNDTRQWRDWPITKITKRDVLDVIEAMDARGSPGASKRSLVYLRKFFNWCGERDIIAIVPTDRIRSPYPEIKCDRVLSEEEIVHVLQAIKDDRSIFGPVFHLLLLTGQRRAEIAGMCRSELRDLDTEEAIWDIPSDRTKNGKSHLVPLTQTSRRIILGLPNIGDLLFTTTGSTPVSGFGRAKARLDARISELRENDGFGPIAPWTLHDLRRTMVTVMNEKLGIAPHIVEAVVNHMSGQAKSGVAGLYNRALYLDDRRRALDAWAVYVGNLQAD